MRVLFISQYYPPETGGPQNRLASLAEGFASQGHEVHVITEKPNYPTGKVWPEYRGGLFKYAEINGVSVTQCAIWEDHKKSFITRIRFYLSFVATSILAGLKTKGRFDVVIASSPPLFVGISGWVVSRVKRAKYIFDVRDLWPDVAVAMGELNNERAAGIAKRLERFIYRSAAGVTAVTDSFCDDIRETAGDGTPVCRVTNGTVPEVFQVDESVSQLREEFGMMGAKYVGFIGNMGLAQGLDHIVEAAARVKDDRIRFLFVGAGARKDQLQHRAQELGVGNVEFRPRVDLKTAARYMAACDALIVSLGANDIYSKFIPSKLFDTMAAARPMLLNVDGESRKIMEEASAGIFYQPEDADGLASAVDQLFSGTFDHDEIGSRASAYVRANFTREAQALRMIAFAERLANGAASLPVKPEHEELNELAA